MSNARLNKLQRRGTILLSQFALFPGDVTRQLSWNLSRVQKFRSKPITGQFRILVVVHAYWPQQFRVIIGYLNRISIPLTIIVTLPENENMTEVEELLPSIETRHKVSLLRVENAGRDIAPFLKCMEGIKSKDWDLIIKVHTKASQDIWFRTLLESLLGGDRCVKRNLKFAQRFPDGMIVHPLFRYPGHKQSDEDPAMQRLQKILEIHNFNLPNRWFFPAGSMFAIGPATMEGLSELRNYTRAESFENEDTYFQGSLAHVYERFLGLYVCAKGSGLIATSLLDFFDIRALFVKII